MVGSSQNTLNGHRVIQSPIVMVRGWMQLALRQNTLNGHRVIQSRPEAVHPPLRHIGQNTLNGHRVIQSPFGLNSNN